MLTARAAPQPSPPLSSPRPSLAEAKQSLRAEARAKRREAAASLPPAAAGAQMAKLLLPKLLARARDGRHGDGRHGDGRHGDGRHGDGRHGAGMAGAALAGYIPVGTEIDPRPVLVAFARQGGLVALPVVAAKDQPLRFRAWDPLGLQELVPGLLGIPEPHDGELVSPDMVLVPLLAFDRERRRLGQGGGYYDRTLAALQAEAAAAGRAAPLCIGVAYAGQECTAVPAEAHDVALDAIATEAYLLSA